MRMAYSILIAAIFGGFFLPATPLAADAADLTRVRVTDEVIVEDVERLGVHFSGHNFYDSVILKQRVAENFEGTIHRLHVLGPRNQPDEGALIGWNAPADELWTGATFTVLSGPDRGLKGTVTGYEEDRQDPERDDRRLTALLLDRQVRWGDEGPNGVLLDKSDTEAGQLPHGGRPNWEEQFTGGDYELVHGDVPPDTFGNTALKLRGSDEPAWIEFVAQFAHAAPIGGEWRVRFWARRLDGSPELHVYPSTAPDSGFTVNPSREWQRYERVVSLDDGDGLLTWGWRVTGGEVLVNDIEVWQEGDTNPTAFRDSLVETLRELNPGSIRYLRNTRDSLVNSLQPAIRAYSRRGEARRRSAFGTHEFYELCAYLDCAAWATLPGTMYPEEMDQFMEYIGAPADVGLGRLRAELGQPEPWTEVLPAIHVQIGNEAVTFMGTGFFGPDYWEDMISRAKASPYYSDNVVFHVNYQGSGAARILDWTPSADRLTTGGYMLFGLYDDQIEMAGDKPGLYDFVFAQTWHNWLVPENNRNVGVIRAARERGKEISVYEGGNYHTTFGDPPDPPLEQVNRIITGMAGGMNATHSLLLLMKHRGARTMQSFNLSQFHFSPGGAFGNMPGRVRVWGGVLNIGEPARRRFRPRFLALQIANQVMGGDLVETPHSGADPKISVTNRFGAGYGPSRRPVEMTVEDMPLIHSYGFREGDRRGLILVNLDTRSDQDIVVEFPGQVRDGRAQSWVLVGDDLEATNEPDWAPDAPEVTIEEDTIGGFSSGHRVTVPRASMMAIEWEHEPGEATERFDGNHQDQLSSDPRRFNPVDVVPLPEEVGLSMPDMPRGALTMGGD